MAYNPNFLKHLPSGHGHRFFSIFQNGLIFARTAVHVDLQNRIGRINNFSVLPSHKNKGLGRFFFKLLDSNLRPSEVNTFTLLATIESYSFWQKVSFKSVDGSFEMALPYSP